MLSGEDDEAVLSGLPAEVAERVVVELSGRGEQVVAQFRTAAFLIRLAVHAEGDFRLAESAAYNLREALNAVVTDRSPAAGGLPAVLDAWEQYEREVAQPGNDDAASWAGFRAVLRRAEDRRHHDSSHDAKLLDYLLDKSGVEPLSGELDPITEYSRLRRESSQALHNSLALNAVTKLYQATVAWFIRMFTPPETVVQELRELAAQPWRGPEQIVRLRELASDPHHLRVFFTHLADEAWLDHLFDAGVVMLPNPDRPWPVHGLVDGLGRTKPAAVAGVAQRLLAACKGLPVDERLDARFELLVLATRLGPDGHSLIGDIARKHPDNRSVWSLAAGAAEAAEPTARIVEQVGQAILNAGPRDHDSYYYRLLLEPLLAGMNEANATWRTRMVAAKVREAAGDPTAKWIALDIARLPSELGTDDREFLPIAAHYLAKMLIRAHELGVPIQELLAWTEKIPGEVGERLVSRTLILADDSLLPKKIDHMACRLASPTATGDDLDLVTAILASGPDRSLLSIWTDALGSPTPAAADASVVPDDWVKAWRWSAIIPEDLLGSWQAPITAVAEHYGQFDQTAFSQRIPRFIRASEQSPYSVEELTSAPVLDAARVVAGWRPDNAAGRQMLSTYALARTLQSAVNEAPLSWVADPVAVVEALHEPVYVRHYFQALADQAAVVGHRAEQIVAAGELARVQRWTPAVLSTDPSDFDTDWQGVEVSTVDLTAKLADHNAAFADCLDTAWAWSVSSLDSSHGEAAVCSLDDALGHALNSARGRGLLALLALADWEHRHTAVRSDFFDTLDDLIHRPGQAGLEYRAILTIERPRMERIAADWLDQRVDVLFRDAESGSDTVDLSLKYVRATPWLYRTLREEIVAAALRGTENAIAHLLVGMLNGEPGYEIASIIAALRPNQAALARAAAEVARLVQDAATDEPALDTAVLFWRTLLDLDRNTVPAEVLRHTGRWSLVTELNENTWAAMTLQTLTLTDGVIDHAIEVADRSRAVLVPGDSTKILLLLQGRGEPWERHQVAKTALDALRTLSLTRADENFLALRTRLTKLGLDEAADLRPYAGC
ncbi:hypothetical protein ACW9HH_32680 [Nocardia gipuzkoensis]